MALAQARSLAVPWCPCHACAGSSGGIGTLCTVSSWIASAAVPAEQCGYGCSAKCTKYVLTSASCSSSVGQ